LALKNQLHDKRYDAIRSHPDIHLYGKGWPNSPTIPAGDKIAVTRNYQYQIVIENIAMPGYVTEKIIDAIVAGNMPLYLGAPDIESYVPKECFLPWTVETPDLSESDAMAIINAGQAFLRSDLGYKFSYQGFAENLLNLSLK